MIKSLKMLFIIFAWIMAISTFVVAYEFYRMYNINPADLTSSQGVLADEPEFSEDEYGNKTSMRLYLEGEELHVTVPGKLLQRADQEIFALKKGDQVRFYEKKAAAKGFMDGHRRGAMGLGNQDKYFYTLDDALDFYQSPQNMVYMIFCVCMGMIIIYFLLK